MKPILATHSTENRCKAARFADPSRSAQTPQPLATELVELIERGDEESHRLAGLRVNALNLEEQRQVRCSIRRLERMLDAAADEWQDLCEWDPETVTPTPQAT